MPPLGYRVCDRKLIIVEHEAVTVRHMFRRYAALGSVRLLKQELEAHGIAGKSWTSASGRSWGGKPLARGALYLMLQNRIYRGEIVHQDQIYPGEHAAIIDQALWEAVQSRLADNAVERGRGIRVKNPSLLAGLLFDSEGQRMTPTSGQKRHALRLLRLPPADHRITGRCRRAAPPGSGDRADRRQPHFRSRRTSSGCSRGTRASRCFGRDRWPVRPNSPMSGRGCRHCGCGSSLSPYSGGST